MAMKRSLELGSFALAAALIFGFVACDDSSGDDTTTATGGAPAVGGMSGGGVAGISTGLGGSTAGAGTADCNTNLLAVGLGDTGNWIGGDPTIATDNPCSIQGALYAYNDGDKDADGKPIPGTGRSCNPPDPIDCKSGSCTISGATIEDSTYVAWGCGIGLTLADPGDGTKTPFAGQTTGFQITIEGTFTQEVRIGYTYHNGSLDSTGIDKVAPFYSLKKPGTYQVMFKDVTCPDWDTAEGCQVSIAPYDLQIQVCGGEKAPQAGPFTLTITNITPVTGEGKTGPV